MNNKEKLLSILMDVVGEEGCGIRQKRQNLLRFCLSRLDHNYRFLAIFLQ
jgi:hypothetical protein